VWVAYDVDAATGTIAAADHNNPAAIAAAAAVAASTRQGVATPTQAPINCSSSEYSITSSDSAGLTDGDASDNDAHSYGCKSYHATDDE